LLAGTRRWFAGGVGETKLLTYDLLAEVISSKTLLVARARATKVWLLIAVDIFPFSASFSAPAEVDT